MSTADSTQFDPQRHGPELSAYLDNELSGTERAEVERLLAESPEARAAVAELREVSDALRSLPREPSPIDFAASVRRDGRLDGQADAAPPAERVWRLPSAVRVLAGAAVLAICVSTTWKLMLPAVTPLSDSLTAASRIGEPPATRAPGAADAGRGGDFIADRLFRSPEAPAIARLESSHVAVPPGPDAVTGFSGGLSATITGIEPSSPARSERHAGEPGGESAVRELSDGRIIIPTNSTEQYNNVLAVVSAFQQSSGDAPTYSAYKVVPEPEATQLRVPIDRATEVLTVLNNTILPEQMRVEFNVSDEASLRRQVQMFFSPTASQPETRDELARGWQIEPSATLGAPMHAPDDEANRERDGSEALEDKSAAAADAPASPSGDARLYAARPRAESRKPAAMKTEESSKAADADEVASAKKLPVAQRAAGRIGGGESAPRGGAAAGGGAAGRDVESTKERGVAGAALDAPPASAPAELGQNLDAAAQRNGGERVTALITRGQAVWTQLSNSAVTIANRFSELTQSNRRESAADGYLTFDVMVLPPPTTQPAAEKESAEGQSPR